eukprot:COSAG01_NODE_7_length_54400_cov_1218.054935_28_plen_239_part_00
MNLNAKQRKSLFFFLVCIGLSLFASQLPLFTIKDVQIYPHESLRHETIEGLQIHYQNKNIWRSLLQIKKQKEWQNIHDIESITINIKWPHTLVLNIQEKKPFLALWNQGKNIIIAADGYHLNKPLYTAIQSPLMIIKNLDYKLINNEKLTPDLLKTLTSLQQEVKQAFPTQNIQLSPIMNKQWRLFLNDTLPIDIQHDPQHLASQLKRLKKIFQGYNKINHASYIDLRIPKKVIISYD